MIRARRPRRQEHAQMTEARPLRRAAIAAATLCAAFAGPGPGAQAGPEGLTRAPHAAYSGRAAEQAATVRRPDASAHLHFLEPASGQGAPIGELVMRVAPVTAGGRTAEVLLAWNSDPRGFVSIDTCRIALDQLVSGVRLPARATKGHTGRFTMQARIVEPFQGSLSAPVDVVLTAADGAEARSFRRAPTYEDLRNRPRPDPVGDFACLP
jgi:hypothetical protein